MAVRGVGIPLAVHYTPPILRPYVWGTYSAVTALTYAGRFGTYVLDKRKGIQQKDLGHGHPIWWNKHRIVHIMIMIIFCILAVTKSKYIVTAPLLDAVFGAVSFVNKRGIAALL